LLLIDQFNLTIENRKQRLSECIISALSTSDSIGNSDRVAILKKFIDSNVVIRDLLVDALKHDVDYQITVMELYVLKIYQKTHFIDNITCGSALVESTDEVHPWVKFQFMTKNVESVVHDNIGSLNTRNISYSDLASLARNCNKYESGESSIHKSNTELSLAENRNPIVRGDRLGLFTSIDNLTQLAAIFPYICGKFPIDDERKKPVNVIHIVVKYGVQHHETEEQVSDYLSSFLTSQESNLIHINVR
jgi:hypothetical protein